MGLIRLLLLALVASTAVLEELNRDANAEDISSASMTANTARSRHDDSEHILEQALTIADTIEDSYDRATILNDIARQYAELGKKEKATAILSRSLEVAQKIEDTSVKVTLMLAIANIYFDLDRITIANDILSESLEIANSIEDESLKSRLLIKIALKYAKIGQDELTENLLSQSQELIGKASEPVANFPFEPAPVEGSFGFGGIVNSFDVTTSTVFANMNLYKQWAVDDIDFEADVFVSFDSGRIVNQYRPGGLIINVYRHHFNPKWHFHTTSLTTGNLDIFSADNDDEDLSFITNNLVGIGLNLWRGKRRQFLDLQLGIGGRYEYASIDFEVRKNETAPIIDAVILSKGISLGTGTLEQIFAFTLPLNDFDNFFILSRTKLSIPLAEKWTFNNTIWLRYRNQELLENNPNLQFIYTTGINYKF